MCNAEEVISIEDMVACIEREIGFRERCYPRWVADKKLTQKTADLEIARMKSIKRVLVEMANARV